MSSPAISRPVSTMSAHRHALLAEMLLEREALGRRIADAELELRRGIEPRGRRDSRAPWRRRARRASPRRTSPQAPSRRAASCASPRAPPPPWRISAAARRPWRRAARPPPGTSTPSVSITKSKMLPFLPEEKSNHACFWSLTKNDGGLFLVERRQPLPLAPGLLQLHAPAHHLRNRKAGAQFVEELGREAHGSGRPGLGRIACAS